jgi:hypothetical protein
MAMFIMSANCSGIVGSQLFQAKDSPLYRTGWTVTVCLVSAGVLFATFNVVQYWASNKQIETANERSNTEQTSNDSIEKAPKYYS